MLKRQYEYVILPANQTDFSNLILEKLRKFLTNIESEIRKARDKKITKDQFYAITRSRLKSINTFGRPFGDLMLLWSVNKELFWSFVSLDSSLARKKMTQIVLAKLAEFYRICKGHTVEFSEDEQKLSDGLYFLIKKSRNKGAIQHSANDEDLLILADCFIYKNKRFLQGFMYLLTDDEELHGTTSEIILHPNLIFEDFNPTDRFIGFGPIRPKKFIKDFETKTKK